MKPEKFKEYLDIKKEYSHPLANKMPTSVFEEFLEDKPTRKQFGSFLNGLAIEADHMWIMMVNK